MFQTRDLHFYVHYSVEIKEGQINLHDKNALVVQHGVHNVNMVERSLNLSLNDCGIDGTNGTARNHFEVRNVVLQRHRQCFNVHVLGPAEGYHHSAFLKVAGFLHRHQIAVNLVLFGRVADLLRNIILIVGEVLLAHVGDTAEKREITRVATILDYLLHHVVNIRVGDLLYQLFVAVEYRVDDSVCTNALVENIDKHIQLLVPYCLVNRVVQEEPVDEPVGQGDEFKHILGRFALALATVLLVFLLLNAVQKLNHLYAGIHAAQIAQQMLDFSVRILAGSNLVDINLGALHTAGRGELQYHINGLLIGGVVRFRLQLAPELLGLHTQIQLEQHLVNLLVLSLTAGRHQQLDIAGVTEQHTAACVVCHQHIQHALHQRRVHKHDEVNENRVGFVRVQREFVGFLHHLVKKLWRRPCLLATLPLVEISQQQRHIAVLNICLAEQKDLNRLHHGVQLEYGRLGVASGGYELLVCLCRCLNHHCNHSSGARKSHQSHQTDQT